MLGGETILCFAPDSWEGLWRNRHQIMTRLARRNIVLYVEPRLYFPETLRRLRDGRLRVRDFRSPLLASPVPYPSVVGETTEKGRFWLYHDPYYAPFSGRLTGGPLTAVVRRRALLIAMRSSGAAAPILWLLRPYQADQIGQYGEKLVVYHVTDEYSAYPSVTDKSAFLRQEEALLRRADLVIVTSPGLLASKGRSNRHTYLVPNAVDYDGFQKAIGSMDFRGGTTDQAVPDITSWMIGAERSPNEMANPDARHQRAKISLVGYAGALNEKLDYRLLAAVARAHPEWQIVLIGNLDLYSQPEKADPLRGLPNVHWPGRLTLERLPRAVAALDVCLLPYEQNEWTANIDSLKLYEYLACGRPVVSTDVPTARSFADVVRIAGDTPGFVAQIEAALVENDPGAVERRKAVAASNTWEQRVAQIEGLLAAALVRRGAKPA